MAKSVEHSHKRKDPHESRLEYGVLHQHQAYELVRQMVVVFFWVLVILQVVSMQSSDQVNLLSIIHPEEVVDNTKSEVCHIDFVPGFFDVLTEAFVSHLDDLDAKHYQLGGHRD